FSDTQRLALVHVVPPSIQHGMMLLLLCKDCRKYHGLDWPVRVGSRSGGKIIRYGYTILSNPSKISCSGRRPEKGAPSPMPIKPCKSCWALGPMERVGMPCACGRWQYVLISLDNNRGTRAFGWRRWR